MSHTVTWYHPNGTVVIRDRFVARIFVSMDYSELRRSGNFESTRDGIYTCVITDESNFNQSLFLGVYSENKQFLDTTLAVDTNPSGNETKLSLNCSSRGLPATSVNWFFGNRLITVGASTQHIPDKRKTIYHSLLTISRQDLENQRMLENEVYSCRVNANLSSANAAISFNISKIIAVIVV